MKKITIVGAGFSGLTLGYYLNKLGVPVRILEREARPGGLIQTRRTPQGLIETAANALLGESEVEDLFRDLKMEFAPRLKARKKRYIYWSKPRRWPLSPWTTLKMARLPFVKPLAGESVTAWGTRAVNRAFTDRLLVPALQGVYAGDAERLSASMIFGKRRPKSLGSVAPVEGMGQLLQKLGDRLRVQYSQDFQTPAQFTEPTVLCTSAWAAASLVEFAQPELSRTLRACESLPLVSVTVFFKKARRLKGFGCLFPKEERFHALGVLFNDCIFEGRGPHSETWIFGGALNRSVCELTDMQLVTQLITDRRRLTGDEEPPAGVHVTRWPRAIPHYTLDWELALRGLNVERPLFLHGNYLGQLGLSSILRRSKSLAQHLKDLYAG